MRVQTGSALRTSALVSLVAATAGCLGRPDDVGERSSAIAIPAQVSPPSCETPHDVPQNPLVPGLRTNSDIDGRTIAFALKAQGNSTLGLYDLGADGTLGGGDDGGEFFPPLPSGESINDPGPSISGRFVAFSTTRFTWGGGIPSSRMFIRLYDLGPDLTAGTLDDSGPNIVDDSALSGPEQYFEAMHGRYLAWAGPIPFLCPNCLVRWCDTSLPTGLYVPGACEPGGWSVAAGTGIGSFIGAHPVEQPGGPLGFYWNVLGDLWSRYGTSGAASPAVSDPLTVDRYGDTDGTGINHVYVSCVLQGSGYSSCHIGGLMHLAGTGPAGVVFGVSPTTSGTFEGSPRISSSPGAIGELWAVWLRWRGPGLGDGVVAAIWDPGHPEPLGVEIDAPGASPSVYANEVVYATSVDPLRATPLRYTRCWGS